MALHKCFYIFQDTDISTNSLVFFDDFYKFFEDKCKKQNVHLRRSFVLRSLKNIKHVDRKEAVTVREILRYCFSHCEDYDACKEIVRVVEHAALHKTSSETQYVSSSFDLYKLIAKCQFQNVNDFLQHLDLDESVIPTLVNDHKGLFSQSEWKKIVWFEYHFAKDIFVDSLSYEDLLKLKWNKYSGLLSFENCRSILELVVKKHLKERFLRRQAAQRESSEQLCIGQTHIYRVIDSEITSLVQEHYPETFGNCLVFEHDYDNKEDGLCVLVEVTSGASEDAYNFLGQTIKYCLQNNHQLCLKKVIYLQTDTIQQYVKGDAISRFQLRDDLLLNKLPENSYVFRWEDSTEDLVTENLAGQDETKNCDTCYNIKLPAPLTLKQFEVIKEWHLDIPIEIQILLGVFINPEMLRKTNDVQSYLRQKLEKLFTLYDGLLNTRNKNYIGIFQQANTDELLYDYRSIKSVFRITAASGATSSHVKAELDWKKRADDDMLYYNTYLKLHPLTYQTDAGEETKGVSLRQCHTILMLDNLVRIQHTSMTWRGETQSKQLATLPLTIQGLPTDSAVTETWHDQAICDGTVSCPCKKKVTLTSQDIDRVLLVPSRAEQTTNHQFQSLCSWGYLEVWQKMPDDLANILEERNDIQDANETLSEVEVESVEKQANNLTEDDNDEENENFSQLLRAVDVRELEESADIAGIDWSDVIQQSEDLYSEEREVDLDESVIQEPMDNVSNLVTEQTDEAFTNNITQQSLDCEAKSTTMVEMKNIQTASDLLESKVDNTIEDMPELENSFLNLSIVEEQEPTSGKEILESFGFTKFTVPSLLTRHPPPAVGRDDDTSKIREILDDVLLKLGYLTSTKTANNRILCGPDHKVGNCLLKLMSVNEKYETFLPEFPLLHLRKSMITILFSAYNDAGLFHILRYMRDDDKQEWSSLVSVHHIDMATRNVRRISISLHLAFLISFARFLPESECEEFLADARHNQPAELSRKWSGKFDRFMDEGSSKNATFALHRDIMKHCDKVVAIALAERLGGKQGYELLLANVKASLAFAFINGASSYGPYCVKLLFHHYSAGHFHGRLKETLFTTPIGNSKKNFACDTKREMDHLEAVKGFRSGSTISSVTARMSLIDSLNEATNSRNESAFSETDDEDNLGWTVTDVDLSHIYPTASLILKRCALSLQENPVPFNVYSSTPTALPPSILDCNSSGVGEFLIKRYLVKEKLFQYNEADLRKVQINGPTELVNRAKRSKGTTLKRMLKSKIVSVKTDRETKEEMRQKLVEKKTKEIDCFTSEGNAAQALLKPDLSKPKVYKSISMPRAILAQINSCIKEMRHAGNDLGNIQVQHCLLLGTHEIPKAFASNVSFATMEFAGVKFKTGHCTSGRQYLDFAESIIRTALKQFPKVSKLVICEEKYTHTPDDFKCFTRLQRQSNTKISIEHLKDAQSVLSETKFSKDVLTTTPEGKSLISNYLADHIDKLSFRRDLCLVIDSELVMEKCQCVEPCSCKPPAIPISKTFHQMLPPAKTVTLTNIKQCKGEAEMSQVDWLIQEADKLKPGEAAASIVTSGDIDSVYIHLFALSLHWPRDEQGKFCNPVFIILQKPESKNDVYNVTLMLEVFEAAFSDKMVGVKLAVALCIGGNDYIPKLQEKSHTTVVQKLLTQHYRQTLYSSLSSNNIVLDVDKFVNAVKELYCTGKMKKDAASVNYETVRAITIGKKTGKSTTGYVTRDAKLWLPPESVIRRVAELVQLQVDYLLTVGSHEKPQPDFLSKNCLKKTEGKVEYDFGPDAHFDSVESLPDMPTKEPSKAQKRSQDITPQKGARRKQPKTSTPVKHT